ncbi:MAG: cadherin-like domain-containing protein, partial [Pirellulaceae bacterium]|nr:cadherin-like domain-containing protein [Pirellulaceae bacterium]
WKSDGSPAGTSLVKDIRPGAASSGALNHTNINGTLFFTANDGIGGVELWRSDGTAPGTAVVKDIVAGSGSSSPAILTGVNGRLFFRANDGVNGEELWTSDGTSAGTTVVSDIFTGSGSSIPQALSNINGTLYFTAEDWIHGREPWVLVVEASTNEAPTAIDDFADVNEDGPTLSITLTTNDTDPNPSDDLEISALNLGGTIGLVTANADNESVSYDPDGQFDYLAAGETESDSFTYTISDGRGGTSTAAVTMTVQGQNDDPVLEADSADVTILEGETATNDGIFFDLDLSDNVTITASQGTVTKSGISDGSWSWSYFGADDETTLVTITADDGQGGIATTTFDLTVDNVAPRSVLVTNRALVGSGSNATFTANVSFIDPGADNWTATIDYGDGTTAVSLPLVSRSFGLEHLYVQPGTYRATITIADDDGGSVVKNGNTAIAIGSSQADRFRIRAGSIIIELNGLDIAHLEDIEDVLVWGGDGDDVIEIDPAVVVPTTLLGGAGDDLLTAGSGPTILDGGAGDDTLEGGSGANTVIGGSGNNTFIPGSGTSTSGSSSPEAFADHYQVAEDGRLEISPLAGVVANDVPGSESQMLTVVAVNGSAAGIGELIATLHGAVILNSDGSFTYTPGAGCEAASDSFTYAISDANGATATATVAITIVKAVADGNITVDSGGVVRVGGTEGNDLIVLTAWHGQLYSNFQDTGITLASITEIRVWTREGNDIFVNLTGLNVDHFIHGGQGNDLLTGGSAQDVIFGGDGDDLITGGAGNDFLIGGAGKDWIVGSAGHDILVSGDVACSLELAALRNISRAWGAARSIADGAVDDFLDEALIGDNSSDLLTGGSGGDLFIINTGDKITDFKIKKSGTNQDGDVVIIV